MTFHVFMFFLLFLLLLTLAWLGRLYRLHHGLSHRGAWATVLQRIEQGETLRHVARDYGVSYEAVRRVLRVATKWHL